MNTYIIFCIVYNIYIVNRILVPCMHDNGFNAASIVTLYALAAFGHKSHMYDTAAVFIEMHNLISYIKNCGFDKNYVSVCRG